MEPVKQNSDTGLKSQPKPRIALYSQSELFARNLERMLSNKIDLTCFRNVETLINSHMNLKWNGIILDFDPPTEWTAATDVFTNIKTVDPSAVFIVCTAKSRTEPCQVILKRGANLISKPVQIDALMGFLRAGT